MPRREQTVFLITMAVGLLFAVVTNHAWEDYWITFRSSRNLATGAGLVFNPGERLHTFTSPLGVLLPAGLSWLTGNKSEELILWLFRLVSLTAFAAGMVLICRLLAPIQKHGLALVLPLGLLMLDPKTVDFSINGMETGLLFFFLSLTVHGLLVAGPRQTLRIGAGWAGLMWTRPDSFVYIGILALGWFLFFGKAAAGPPLRQRLSRLLAAGLIGAALYLPWFLWAWSYYGTPIPHTIIAKAVNHPPLGALELAGSFLKFPIQLLIYKYGAFLPAMGSLGGWPNLVHAPAYVLETVAAFIWLCPLARPQARLFSLAYYLGMFFLTQIVRQVFPWYLPMVTTFAYLACGIGFDQLLGLAGRLPALGWNRGWFRRLDLVLRSAAVLLIAGQAALLVCVGRQMQVQQELVEDGVRMRIGLWLREHAGSKDTVYLEPLGYIGYFSHMKTYDYPGLSSREVVAARRKLGPAKQNQCYLELKPDWMVLRPQEITGVIDPTRLHEFYEQVAAFDASKEIRAVSWLPGRPYVEFDQSFLIFHRKATPTL